MEENKFKDVMFLGMDIMKQVNMEIADAEALYNDSLGEKMDEVKMATYKAGIDYALGVLKAMLNYHDQDEVFVVHIPNKDNIEELDVEDLYNML